MKRKRWVGVVLLWLCALASLGVFGCARTPASAIALSGQVAQGVRHMQADTERVIAALADTQRAALDDAWEATYASAERRFRESEGIGAAELTLAQRTAVAAIAAATRERALGEIATKQAELVDASRANAGAVLAMHDAVTAHLFSIRSAQHTREEVVTLLDSMTGLDIAPALADLSQMIAALEEDTQGRE